jgi:SulP family sulfate permease
MSTNPVNNKSRKNPIILAGILPIDRSRIIIDISAGVTLAALAIPEVMGYTKIAGMPVVTGLYTILIPIVIYALFGSSRHLVVGADSATAAIMASGLLGMAVPASRDYITYAAILAFMAAVMLILARIIRLGFIADFLSKTVLIGFLTGVGIQVAISQLPGMLGTAGGGTDLIRQIITDIRQLGQVNLYTLFISLSVIVVILGIKKIDRKLPGALLAVVVTIVVSYMVDLSTLDVKLIGSVPSGLPRFGFPIKIALNGALIGQLFPISFSMFIVILAQSAATSRAFADRYHERFDENTDLVGLGLANFGASLTGSFVVNGSPTKTQMVDSAGGRSQISTITTAIIVLIVLLFFTKLLTYMPEAVLSTVVFLIGIELIDFKGMRNIFAERPVEFWVALITSLVVIFIGVEQGIFLAIGLSIIIHTRHGYKPKNAVLETDPSGKQRMVPVSSHAQVLPGLVIYRFHHSMYFANAEYFLQEVVELVDDAQPPISWFCIDATAMDDIDYSAAGTLREICLLLKGKSIRMVFVEVAPYIFSELEKSHIIDLIGTKAVYQTINDVEDAYKQRKQNF